MCLKHIYAKCDDYYGDELPNDPEEAHRLQTTIAQAEDEAEISIIGSIGLEQISVWDQENGCFIPLSTLSPSEYSLWAMILTLRRKRIQLMIPTQIMTGKSVKPSTSSAGKDSSESVEDS